MKKLNIELESIIKKNYEMSLNTIQFFFQYNNYIELRQFCIDNNIVGIDFIDFETLKNNAIKYNGSKARLKNYEGYLIICIGMDKIREILKTNGTPHSK